MINDNVSIIICSCLNKPERSEYLDKCVENIYKVFNKDMDILIGFDKYGKEVDGARCLTHEKGMGYSWNWGIQNAKHEYILQLEDDWVVEIGGANEERLPDLDTFNYHMENRMKVLDKFGGLFKFTYLGDEHYKSGKTKREYEGYDFLQFNRTPVYRPNTWEMYYYSNQPHMKKKSLHDKVGFYLENAPPHDVEIDMCKKFYDSGESAFACSFFTYVHIGFQSARKDEVYTTTSNTGNVK